MDIEMANFTRYGMVSACIFLIGAVLFVWFCWPAVFKGMLNAGNVCGMLATTVMMFYSLRCKKIHQLAAQLWQKKPMRLFFCLSAVLVAVAVALAVAAAVAIIGAASNKIPANTPAVVLGCAVKGTRPSRVLQERIDAATAYLQDNPQAVCILSGGQGRGEDISEAECMYRELVRAGIDADRLYLESESVNTRQNLEHSLKILQRLEQGEAVTVISSDFHLYRGKWWAAKLGYHNYGYAAKTDWRYLPTLFVREVIAVVYLWFANLW